jgi:hypothetical protein
MTTVVTEADVAVEGLGMLRTAGPDCNVTYATRRASNTGMLGKGAERYYGI